MISTRHIRKDWPEWVDWPNQKTVSTMCGVRSRPGLCGIPGITNQPQIVERSGVKAWGWCGRCVNSTWPYLMPPVLSKDITSTVILDLHRSAQEQLVRQYKSILGDKLRRAQRDNHLGTIQALDQMIAELNDDFFEVLNNTPVS